MLNQLLQSVLFVQVKAENEAIIGEVGAEEVAYRHLISR